MRLSGAIASPWKSPTEMERAASMGFLQCHSQHTLFHGMVGMVIHPLGSKKRVDHAASLCQVEMRNYALSRGYAPRP